MGTRRKDVSGTGEAEEGRLAAGWGGVREKSPPSPSVPEAGPVSGSCVFHLRFHVHHNHP